MKRVTNISLLLLSTMLLLMRPNDWFNGRSRVATKWSKARVIAITSEAGTPLPLTSPMAKWSTKICYSLGKVFVYLTIILLNVLIRSSIAAALRVIG